MKLIILWILCVLALNSSGAQPNRLNLLGHWRDSSVVGSKAYDNAFNEAWGLYVNGHEYAVIGSTSGTHLIDITDPRHPFERMLIKGAFNGDGVIHRDYDDYKCHLYAVCDEGASSLQIIDFSSLPDTAYIVYDSREFMTRVHNIFIDIPKARLYTCAESGVAGFQALGVYDISIPAKPKFIGHYNRFGDITAGHVHDAYARNDTVYLNCGNDGFAIMDFSNPQAIKPIFTAKPNEYPHAGYNHSGWLTPDGKTYVMADENHGSPLKVLDLSDIEQTKTVSLLFANKDTSVCIPHNPLVSCQYAYVSYYYDGLQVYNIKDPSSPKLEYYYPTSKLPNHKSYKGSWGNYPYLPSGNLVVADMQNGLFILEGIEQVCNKTYNCLPVNTQQVIESHHFQISPNPVCDRIYFSTEIPFALYHICVYDINGNKINQTFTLSDNSISVDQLNPGFYILEMNSQNFPPYRKTFIKL